MGEAFTHRFRAGWGEMDYNAHMGNTAYLDLSADTRLMYFEASGFSAADFEHEEIGPVVLRDLIEYKAEIRLQEEFSVSLELAGISHDGSRFRLRNTFTRTDGRVAAVVTTDAGWLSLERRKLVAPPRRLLSAMNRLTRTDDYEDLPPSVRKPPGE
jgi:acyl-CoA thioester hydrolase